MVLILDWGPQIIDLGRPCDGKLGCNKKNLVLGMSAELNLGFGGERKRQGFNDLA